MDEFVKALLEPGDGGAIPQEDDWYAPLLGDWDFDYVEPGGRRVKGEWLFRRVLEGAAIQDLFLCPSREARKSDPQPDGEYGAAIRLYDREKRCYHMTYVCAKGATQLEVRHVRERIECVVLDDPRRKWCFSHITPDAFHWQNETHLKDGSVQVNCEVFARRKP